MDAAGFGPEHLVLSHFSLRETAFDDRVAAAAAAGFDGIGWLIRDYVAAVDEAGRSPGELAETVAAHGLALVELEAVRGWSAAEPAGSTRRTVVDRAMEMADVFGARHLTAIGDFDGPLDEAVAGFGRLCDRAADHGLRVGLEPMPTFRLPDVAAAREIVEQAGRANGGLCVDSWHLTRGGARWDQLEDLPGELVTSIQIDDGTVEPEHPDYLEDTLTNRRPCGEGEFDLIRFVRTLDRIGATAPYSVEVISTELQARPAPEAARRLAESTRAVLRQARSSR